jgi:tetratricopeptide (TPR) repeat protein
MANKEDTFEFYTTDPLEHSRSYLDEKKNAPASQTRQVAKTALEICDKNLDAWLLLAKTYQKFPQTRDTYLEAISLGAEQKDSASYKQLLYELGTLYYHHDELEKAIDTFLELLPLDESDPCNAREILTLCYLYQEDYLKAHAAASHKSYDGSLSSHVAQAFIAFRSEIPWWTPDQMDDIDSELLGRTLWQWMHEQCNSLKRLYRQINHANPFFTAFMLAPRPSEIASESDILEKHASEALHVAQLHHDLWHDQELPIKLLEEFPWTNPGKSEIIAEDKPLLLEAIKQLEAHREQVRTAAERDHLGQNDLF